jgi:acetyltransferase-like isoleucine patch superfamily enzyme
MSIVHSSLACQKEGARLCVGSNVFIGGGTKIVSTSEVLIGNHVLISFGCYVTDTDGHALDYKARSDDVINRINGWKDWSRVKSAPVSIGAHSWIGPNVVILKGVTIGRGVIVGAGSVVTKDLPDFSFAAGVPAQIVKVLEQE